jgi:hypothetical protein
MRTLLVLAVMVGLLSACSGHASPSNELDTALATSVDLHDCKGYSVISSMKVQRLDGYHLPP